MWTGAVRTRASTRGMGRRCVSCNAMCSLRLFSLMCSVSLFTGEEMSDRQRGDENKVAEDDNGHLVVEVVKRDLWQCQKRRIIVIALAHLALACRRLVHLASAGCAWQCSRRSLSHSLPTSFTHALPQSVSLTHKHTHTHTHSLIHPPSCDYIVYSI
jgi:hypothetical protein